MQDEVRGTVHCAVRRRFNREHKSFSTFQLRPIEERTQISPVVQSRPFRRQGDRVKQGGDKSV